MDVNKLFTMKKPCKECPFRKDGTMYKSLRPDRMDEIIQSLHNDAPFHCHKTIDYSQDDHADQVDDAVYCAGALGYMVKAKDSNLPMRLGMMFDLFRPDELQDLDDLIDPKEE